MDFTSILKVVAPWLGAAIGGPLGSLAVDVATQALGVSEKTADGLKKALAGATPEDMLKLKQADQTFAVQMRELGFKNETDLEKIAADDRASARGMQISNKSRMPAILTTMVTAGYFGVLIGMMSNWLHVADTQVLMLMLGSLTTAWASCIAFWVGTTHDSGRKTEMLAQAEPVK